MARQTCLTFPIFTEEYSVLREENRLQFDTSYVFFLSRIYQSLGKEFDKKWHLIDGLHYRYQMPLRQCGKGYVTVAQIKSLLVYH